MITLKLHQPNIELPRFKTWIRVWLKRLAISDREKMILKIMFTVLIVNFAAFLIFLKVLISPTTFKAEAYVPPVAPQIIADINASILDPKVLDTVKRPSFSVAGNMVMLHGDNVTVFEYKDSAAALSEGNMFAEKNKRVLNSTDPWSDQIHLYLKDASLIFYMGHQKDILDSFSKSSKVLL